MRSSLFGDVTHLLLVINHRRFGTAYRFYLQKSSSSLKMGPTSCP